MAEVVENVLRTRARLSTTSDRARKVNTDEAKAFHDPIMYTLMQLMNMWLKLCLYTPQTHCI